MPSATDLLRRGKSLKDASQRVLNPLPANKTGTSNLQNALLNIMNKIARASGAGSDSGSESGSGWSSSDDEAGAKGALRGRDLLAMGTSGQACWGHDMCLRCRRPVA